MKRFVHFGDYDTVTYANMTKDGKIGKYVTNMHKACAKNVFKILEIEVKAVVFGSVVLRRELNQRARRVSTCVPQSQEFLEHFLAHALCIFATYLPILPSLVIFAYVTNEGHRSDRNVLIF